jgi:hypothetical protein
VAVGAVSGNCLSGSTISFKNSVDADQSDRCNYIPSNHMSASAQQSNHDSLRDPDPPLTARCSTGDIIASARLCSREIFQSLFHTVFEFITNSVQPEFLEEFVAKSPSSAIAQLKAAVTQLKSKPTKAADCAILARSTFGDLFVREITKVVNENETNEKS